MALFVIKAVLKIYKNVKGLYNSYSEVEGSLSFLTLTLSNDTTLYQGPEQNNRYKHVRKSSNFMLQFKYILCCSTLESCNLQFLENPQLEK
jgi:hypothetical protein